MSPHFRWRQPQENGCENKGVGQWPAQHHEKESSAQPADVRKTKLYKAEDVRRGRRCAEQSPASIAEDGKARRDRDQKALNSEEFKKVLLAFKRMQSYVDAGSPGRNWNDATAMLISGKGGMQIMGDWVKGEFAAAKQVPGKDFGCIPGLNPASPYLIQGDAFVFPKTSNADTVNAQKLLAKVMLAPTTQLEFNKLKGSIPIRTDVDTSSMDICAQAGMAIMKDKSRQVGISEVFLTPDQNGAMQDVLTAFWNTRMPVEKAQKSLAAALKN